MWSWPEWWSEMTSGVILGCILKVVPTDFPIDWLWAYKKQGSLIVPRFWSEQLEKCFVIHWDGQDGGGAVFWRELGWEQVRNSALNMFILSCLLDAVVVSGKQLDVSVWSVDTRLALEIQNWGLPTSDGIPGRFRFCGAWRLHYFLGSLRERI